MGNCGGAVLCVGGSSPTFESCWFLRSSSEGMGGAVHCGSFSGYDEGCAPSFKFCVFAHNSGPNGGAIAVWAAGPTIENCTFVHNTATTAGGAIDYYAFLQVNIDNTIIAFNSGTCAVLTAASGDTPVGCCNIFGNQGGDWTGSMADYQHMYGNISADPLFLDAGAGDYRLSPGSPCCPDSSACGLMGALSATCP